jgi:hypothetical protein
MPPMPKSLRNYAAAKTTSEPVVQDEAQITCPFCWENLTILLDLSLPDQDYIEDCQVCCQPIRIHYTSDAGMLISLDVAQDS